MKRKQIILFAMILLLVSCKETQENTETQQIQSVQEEQSQTQQTPTSSTITPETVKQYIPEGFKLIVREEETNLLTGDFNGDKLEDFAMMLASNDAEMLQDAADVRVIIFENDGSKFTEKARSGNLSGFFVHQAPTSQLSLSKNIISLKHQAMRSDYEWKYRFEEKYDNYMLIGSEHNNYGNAVNDGSGNVSTNYLSGVRIEKLNKWDEKKEELIELPEKKIKVSKDLLSLSKLNEENYSDL